MNPESLMDMVELFSEVLSTVGVPAGVVVLLGVAWRASRLVSRVQMEWEAACAAIPHIDDRTKEMAGELRTNGSRQHRADEPTATRDRTLRSLAVENWVRGADLAARLERLEKTVGELHSICPLVHGGENPHEEHAR